MNAELKAYFANIGSRGGAASSEAKSAAVRANGAKGGRPRKDGLPSGARPLSDVLDLISNASHLSPPARRDIETWVRMEARWTADGLAYVPRESMARAAAILEPKPAQS